ncbi:MAG: GntR family transcriptional regulator [Gemmatimonadales bacterium]|nr:MAG: GntR family transcriptional regulator [Gemmatimonadales bacterium]
MTNSSAPLHERISNWLRDRIESGELAPEERLPSENQLCRQFEVSRVTVRRALQTLESEGAIVRRQGIGSFVADRRVRQGLVRLTDFHQDMARAGLEASSKILHRAMEPATPVVAARLATSEGQPVLRLDRLRLADDEPVALDRTWLPAWYAQLLDGHDLANRTLYGILEDEYGIPILSGTYRITADVVDPAGCRALGIRSGEPLLVIERTSRTTAEKPVYFQRRYYRRDRMAYELELARDPDAMGRDGSSSGEEGMPLREFEAVLLSSPPSVSSDPGDPADPPGPDPDRD